MVAMSKEALRIYNANRRKKGLPLIQDDSDTFTQETEEVTVNRPVLVPCIF